MTLTPSWGTLNVHMVAFLPQTKAQHEHTAVLMMTSHTHTHTHTVLKTPLPVIKIFQNHHPVGIMERLTGFAHKKSDTLDSNSTTRKISEARGSV